uniref:Uncharacterized protein n=1 Tax=Tanacetum cinerariifolium TaxID=118510 RepID=A0A6L2NTW9_TANCI|nr:hypothetical protein [Tanacetum cinerariifolium]
MAKTSSHNTSSPEITPKEEPVTLDKPESPNPFLPATHVEFTFEYTTTTLEDSKVWVSTPTGGVRGDIGYNEEIEAKGTLKKSCLPPRWRLLMGQIIQCLSGKTEHMMPEYDNEELNINPTPVFSVHNWTLKPNQPEEPPFTTHIKAICKLDVHVVSKALKPSLQTEEDMDEETKNYSFDDIFAWCNLSVLVDKTKYAGDELKTTHTNSGINEESRADDILKKIKLEDLSEFLKDTRSAFFTPDSSQDESIIITDENEEEDDMEIELLGDLKEILTKLETFTSTISSLTSQVCHCGGNASATMTNDVPLEGQAIASPVEGEKNTKDDETNLKDELIDLLGTNIVTRYYNKKLLFDNYCDKMLKRKKSPKITNCEVITKKGHITLKIYRKDGSEEVISNLKVSNLHLAE